MVNQVNPGNPDNPLKPPKVNSVYAFGWFATAHSTGGLQQKTLPRVLKHICRPFRPTGRTDAVADSGVTQLLFERYKSGGVQKWAFGNRVIRVIH